MVENSKIEWTTHTFNPWVGCQKVGPGCDNCYAEARDKRFTGGALWGRDAARRRTSPANWKKPLAWNRAAEAAGLRHRVFCASLADVFDNHASILPEWRADLWALIAATPHLDWMLLTKRPGNIAKMLPDGWGGGWKNVWLGCTVVNQDEANRDVPKLLAVPAHLRFLSVEPMLGGLLLDDLSRPAGAGVHEYSALDCDVDPEDDEWRGATIKLVICGGESGPHARPIHPDWVRGLRDQCKAAGVAFFFKQWGEWGPGSVHMSSGQAVFRSFPNYQTWVNKGNTWVFGGICLDAKGRHCKIGADFMRARDEDAFPVTIVHRVGKKAAGRLLDGRTWDQMPGDML